MQMTLRWFGDKFDSVKLWQIRQIPGVTGVITTLYDIPAGDVWPIERIKALQKEVEDAGLEIAGIESVNIHDAIKIGNSEREKYIENYITTLDNLGKCGIKLVCYNFMPVFDWTRTDLAKMRPDGATVLAYDQKVVDSIDPQKFFDQTNDSSNGFVMPGWEPERLSKVKELFEAYKDVDEDTLFNNLVYFLKAIQPVCEKHGIKMAIHPDDPAWPIFGIPRIITTEENIDRFLKLVDDKANGLTLCSGSLGTRKDNDMVHLVKKYAQMDRIHFAHIRNIKLVGDHSFEESAHYSKCGSLDMVGMVEAYHDAGYTKYIRPDHGRMIWDEDAKPGYGLYDRALGAMYITGIWETLDRLKRTK